MKTMNVLVQRPHMAFIGMKPQHSLSCTGKAILRFFLLFALQARTASAAPKLEVDQYEFDAGLQSPTNQFHHSFHLKNTGDADLLITMDWGDCSGRFTESRLEKSSIVPGESTALHVVMRFLPITESAVQSDSIGIRTNEPDGQNLHILRLSGRARSGYLLSPNYIELGVIHPGKAIETSVKLECTAEKTWRLLGVKSTKGLVQTRVQTTEDLRRHDISISIPPQQTTGPIFDEVLFSTDNPDCPMFRVPIIGTCVDPNRPPRRPSPVKAP